MAIKRCTLADLEELGEISVSTLLRHICSFNTEENTRIYLEEAYNLSKLTWELENPQSALYFLQDNDQTVGYIKLNGVRRKRKQSPQRGWKLNESILKEHKRRGVAKTLLLLAQETARAAENLQKSRSG